MDNQCISDAACTHECEGDGPSTGTISPPATPPPPQSPAPTYVPPVNIEPIPAYGGDFPQPARPGATVLITGANRGIGKALVDAFLKRGAKKIYAAVRDITRYRAFSNEENDETIIPLYIDLSKPETIAAAAELSQDVEIVINNAGVLSKTNPLDENAIETLKSEMDVNVYGLMAMAQAYAPILKKNSAERTLKMAFVQLNSVASFRCSGKDVATYSATKAAAYSITQALAQELAPHDVRVLSVHPGPIKTDMVTKDAPPRLLALAEEPSGVADAVLQALEPDRPLKFRDPVASPWQWHVFPDSNSRKLAKIMEPFLVDVVEGGDMYASQIAELHGNYTLYPEPTSPGGSRIPMGDPYGFAMAPGDYGPR